jgi:hypothetical protein
LEPGITLAVYHMLRIIKFLPSHKAVGCTAGIDGMRGDVLKPDGVAIWGSPSHQVSRYRCPGTWLVVNNDLLSNME